MKLDEFTFDPIRIWFSVAGILLGIGAFTIHQSRAITALTAIALMLIGQTGLFSFKFTFADVRVSAFTVKLFGLTAIVIAVFSAAAILNALSNILG